jgi:hypothetical protein
VISDNRIALPCGITDKTFSAGLCLITFGSSISVHNIAKSCTSTCIAFPPTDRTLLVPKPIFFAMDNETNRLPPKPKADGILYGLHEPEGERLTLFVCADKDGTEQFDFSVWH